ncbi:MAG: hypothetical protein IKA97_04770, partial [Clostridia bacterium]|nr:hypothetical protein [Clostridia bacterium]
TRTKAKPSMETPHRIYPTDINIFRFPTLSESAPINIVVKVAVTADAPTIKEISVAEALNIL